MKQKKPIIETQKIQSSLSKTTKDKKKKQKKINLSKALRRISQALFLLLFLILFLQTESKGEDKLGYPVKLFLDFDPLIFFSSILASNAWNTTFLLSFGMIALTLIFHRSFCGWICPFGTLHHIFSYIKKKQKRLSRNWNWFKYAVLITLLTAALFGLNMVGLVDPISFLIRSFTLAIYPFFQYIIVSVFGALYHWEVPVLTDVSEWLYGGLKASVLAFHDPLFYQSFGIGLLLIVILVLNIYQKRFWCRYICPLGALLGLIAKFSFWDRKLTPACDNCKVCTSSCPVDAHPHSDEKWSKTECIQCWNCVESCPQQGITFGFVIPESIKQLFYKADKKPKKQNPVLNGVDYGRRRFLASIGSGILALPLVKATPLGQEKIFEKKLIRPPGAKSENEFLQRCIKCGECMKVCITGGLQPTLWEAGLEGIWTPMLVSRIGYCEYNCTLCGQVCPTDAISELEIKEKNKVKIGLAHIRKDLCYPYAQATECIVCEEVCPVPGKAIWLEKKMVQNRNGKAIEVQQPHVDYDKCIGCGICEHECPVVSEPAIYVTSWGESRSKKNGL